MERKQAREGLGGAEKCDIPFQQGMTLFASHSDLRRCQQVLDVREGSMCPAKSQGKVGRFRKDCKRRKGKSIDTFPDRVSELRTDGSLLWPALLRSRRPSPSRHYPSN